MVFFEETCFDSDSSCMIVLSVALLLCTLPGYFSFAALFILTAFACSILPSSEPEKDTEFKDAISN